MPGIMDLQECKSIGRPDQSCTVVPLLLLGSIELRIVVPIQFKRPGAISKVVADKFIISCVDERGDTIIQKIGDVWSKVLYHIRIELIIHLMIIIASFPDRAVFIHMKCILRFISIQEFLQMREIRSLLDDLRMSYMLRVECWLYH